MKGPLSKIKVLDLTSVVMGPYATQILAELGASIVKVESIDGDNIRHVVPMRNKGMGYMFLNLNRGKKSISLDLKTKLGKEIISKLIKKSDVMVYNIRPQAMSRLGLSYKKVKKISPCIIYAGCYGFSQNGVYADKAAYDDLIQGMSGIPNIFEKITDVPHYAPVNIADRLTGLNTVYSILGALYNRERTGKGVSIEIPMFEAVTQFVMGDHLAGYTFSPPKKGEGYLRAMARRPFKTKNGYICVLIYNDKHWKFFLKIINKSELFYSEKFSNPLNRSKNADYIYNFLEDIFIDNTKEYWLKVLNKNDIPVAPVNSIKDVVNDEHLNKSEFFENYNHPSEGNLIGMRSPILWNNKKLDSVSQHAPNLGENTKEILKNLGYKKKDIFEFLQKKIVK